MALLTILYLMQGVPLGLTSGAMYEAHTSCSQGPVNPATVQCVVAAALVALP